jgi:hypothetical protein
VVERLFAGYGVLRTKVKYVQSYVADEDEDIFHDARVHKTVKTHGEISEED